MSDEMICKGAFDVDYPRGALELPPYFTAKKGNISIYVREILELPSNDKKFWVMFQKDTTKIRICVLDVDGRARPDNWIYDGPHLAIVKSKKDRHWIRQTIDRLKKVILIRETHKI
ncbi:MAG TPA: hypothetical protein VIE65_03160 [Methylobacter sp.]|jgi:hypothetical protein